MYIPQCYEGYIAVALFPIYTTIEIDCPFLRFYCWVKVVDVVVYCMLFFKNCLSLYIWE